MSPRQRADAIQECLIVAFDRHSLAHARGAPNVTVGAISVVVARRKHAFGERSAHAPSSVTFSLLITAKIAVEMLVMAHLVGVYPRREVFEHRLLDVIVQRAVERRSPHFHDATRRKLEGMRGLE